MDFNAIKKKAVVLLARQLSSKGYELIKEAFEKSNYKHDKTQNLHDSYGCCVYYNGQIIEGTEKYLTPKAVTPRYNYYTEEMEYGKDEIKDFFQNYKPSYKGLELVLAVAMFYGRFLEEGTYGGNEVRRKYNVVTFMSDEARALAEKYKGSFSLL